MRRSSIFLLSFLTVFLIQMFIWQSTGFTDQDVWLARVIQLHEDLAFNSADARNPVYSGHPGMPAVFLASLIYNVGSSPSTTFLVTKKVVLGLQGAVSIINAIVIAASVTIAYVLKPNHIWWVAGGAMIALHPLYVQASPTNAVIAPLAVLAFTTTLWLSKKPGAPIPRRAATILGLTLGLALGTRLVTSVIVVFAVLVYLLRYVPIRVIIFIIGVALLTALVADPLLLLDPINHIQHIFMQSRLNVTDEVLSITLHANDILLFTPFTIIAIILSGVLLFTQHARRTLPVPRSFIILLILVTLAFSIIFLRVNAQSLRHFLPLFFTWEFFLPLFLSEYVSLFRWRLVSGTRNHRRKAHAIVYVGSIVLLVSSQATLLLLAIM